MPTRSPPNAPGVYIAEVDAFPPSMAGVQTAVPAFIGYTQRASFDGKSMLRTPVKIASLADFEAIFGGGCQATFAIQTGSAANNDVVIGGSYDVLQQSDRSRYYLYNSLRLFFANGGSDCYIVAVGLYNDAAAPTLAEMETGLAAIQSQVGPTLLVAPDALLLPVGDFASFNQKMLDQGASLQDRMAIVDIHGIDTIDYAGNPNGQLAALIKTFRAQVKSALSYGAAYAPALATSIVPVDEVNYTNFKVGDAAQLTLLKDQLKAESGIVFQGDPARKKQVDDLIDGISTRYDATLDKNLTAALPVLRQAYSVMAQKLGQLPPSGAMAGVYANVDQTQGVWVAPANVGIAAVIRPMVKIDDNQQSDMNVPVDGKAICAIREFTGRGTLVWGARTLDGNSNDWRYIQVRRTIIYIEQSIKNALDPFVFAANNANTWTSVKSMISSFLQAVWGQGGLMGANPQEAFTVQCGLGSTMTGQDILEGYMIVQVTLAMIRPAEFIALTFKQRMQGS